VSAQTAQSIFANLMRECSTSELAGLLDAIAKEMVVRMKGGGKPPPGRRTPIVGGKEYLDLLTTEFLPIDRLRRTTFAGKPRKPTLRIVAADERPERMQWNAALESWG